MSADSNKKSISKLKTNAFERRMSLAKASLKVGSKFATSQATGIFLSKEKRQQKHQQMLKEQATYLVDEIGKLKGSVVKIGQMMALYGEHFLPKEITNALHSLNDDTPAIPWSELQPYVETELGSSYQDLIIDPTPLGTASLAQVHRATRKSDGLALVIKIQYPGVAEAIDSDLNLFKSLVKVSNVVPQTKDFEAWFGEIQSMLHREVDYQLEAKTTQRFYERLQHDERYVVPQVIEKMCSKRILTMTYEDGIAVNSDEAINLPQHRRDALGEASLEIMVRELFEWGEMQTDPNFGNYLVRLAKSDTQQDKIVLLDFGAIKQFDEALLKLARGFIKAGNTHDKNAMLACMKGFYFFDALPQHINADMADTFLLANEPFCMPQANQDYPTHLLDDNEGYIWAKSDLHARILKFATKVATSRHFVLPPKEFMFISRKFIGAYTFMTVLDARSRTYAYIHEHYS